MRMVCQECHSEDVQINAWCDWSTAAQEWVPNLASDSPAAPFCQVCCQHTEVINMPDKQRGAANMNYKHVSLLCLVEVYGAENNLISSEEELSEQFDEHVAPGVIEHYGEDDTIAINEAFNDWADARCKDGDIHEEQYNQYCYVGRYS